MTREDLSKKLDMAEIRVSHSENERSGTSGRFTRAGHVAGLMALILHHEEMVKNFEKLCYSILPNDSIEQKEMLRHVENLKLKHE